MAERVQCSPTSLPPHSCSTPRISATTIVNATSPSMESQPYHVLLAKDSYKGPRPVDDRLSRDYLSRRYRAFHKSEENERIPFWSGASVAERSLISCCEIVEDLSVFNPDYIRGALVKEKAVEFAGIMALHCTDLVSRSLALAILERTLDAEESQQIEEEIEAKIEPDVRRKRKRKLEYETSNEDESEKDATDSKLPGVRLPGFFAAGGLKLLAQWLVDATAPEPVPTPATNGHRNAQADARRPSPTSPLLFVLLSVLRRLPLDRKLIEESKINKTIKKLHKQVDEVKGGNKNHIDPVFGKHSAAKLKEELSDLMKTWRERITSVSYTLEDPFAAFRAALREKKAEWESFESGEGEKPEWLLKVEVQTIEPSQKKTKHESTTEMAKREREKERMLMVKEDMEKAAQQRQEFLKRLREMQRKKEDYEYNASSSRNRVRWKDGMGPTSRTKNAELLEEVFVFEKDPKREDTLDLDEVIQDAEDDQDLEDTSQQD